MALANFKLAVIGEGITHRAPQGSDSGTAAERAADATPEFITAGLRALEGVRAVISGALRVKPSAAVRNPGRR